MLKGLPFLRFAQAMGVVCLLLIPYTDLGVKRDPKALGDHADMAGAEKPAALETPAAGAPVAEMLAPEDVRALAPMKAILQRMKNAAVLSLSLQLDALANLNPEVFAMIVDRLPPLSDNAAVDAALRAELKAAFAPLALKLKNRTQPLLAKTARDVALEGLDAAERERLMAAQNNAELERMLLEQALKDQLGMMDDAKMPMAGAQPMGGGQRMGGGGGAGDGGGGRGGAAPAPGDRRMSDLSRALSKPEDKPAAKEEKKSSAASTPAKRFAEEKETPEAAAKAPTPPAAGDQPVAKGDPLGKKSPLAPIAPFGSAAPLSAGTNSPAASGAMPLASSPSSNGMGEFGYVNGSGYEAAPNVKFNYRREVGFGSSAGGDDSSSDGAYESEVTMPSGLPLISAASLGSTGAATSLGSSSSPAFSKAMQITLGGLCATKSLNCDRNAK